MAAIYAAAMLDQGGLTGPAAAALLREFRSASDAALKAGRGTADLIDELRERRQKRA
jgi:hypothetical protein